MESSEKKFCKSLTKYWFVFYRSNHTFVVQFKKMDLKKYKCNLVERLGVFLEQEEQLAPLAARILAILLLTDKNGITFEQLVGDLRASKSTISTHLQSLLNNGRINYFTKQGDRKRYFTINPNRILKSIDDMMEK